MKFVKKYFLGTTLNEEMNVDAVLERLREAYGLPDLAALAGHFEMDETTFRVWRSRKKIPSDTLVKASSETGRSVSWLRDGELSPEDKTAPSVFFNQREKQVNLTKEEQALLDNFRAASAEGRLAIAAASAALAKPELKKRKKAA